MNMDQYQKAADSTAKYSGQGSLQGLNYTVLGLVSEAGEVAGKLKKIHRDSDGNYMQHREALMSEIGDCLWYVAMAASELGFTLEAVAQYNLAKLLSRFQRNAIQGSGDDR